jgi:hypothetical protein
MLFGLIQKIEILLRSTFDRHLNKHTSNNFWYLDNKLFKENKKIHGTVNTVRTYFIESQENLLLFLEKTISIRIVRFIEIFLQDGLLLS